MADEFISDAMAEVIKSGENCIQVLLARSRGGLKLTVRTHPRVEDFLKGLGNGEKMDVSLIGRHWTPIGKDTLYVWPITDPVGEQFVEGAAYSYTLDLPGWPLANPNRDRDDAEDGRYALRNMAKAVRGEVLNLSFLRLVGTSEDGVSFAIKGMFSPAAVDKLAERIQESGRAFYVNFLKPYRLMVTVSTQPIPSGF